MAKGTRKGAGQAPGAAARPAPCRAPLKDETPAVDAARGFKAKHDTSDTDSAPKRASAPVRAKPLSSDWHRVGAGLSVRFSIVAGSCSTIDAEWKPRHPTKREVRRIFDRYLAARDSFLRGLAESLGGAVVCVDA